MYALPTRRTGSDLPWLGCGRARGERESRSLRDACRRPGGRSAARERFLGNLPTIVGRLVFRRMGQGQGPFLVLRVISGADRHEGSGGLTADDDQNVEFGAGYRGL